MFFLEDIHQIPTGPGRAGPGTEWRQGIPGDGPAVTPVSSQAVQHAPSGGPSRSILGAGTTGEGDLEISHTNLQPLAQLTSSIS